MTDRLSITKKLILMLIVPIAGLFVFSALQTSEKLTLVSDMEKLDSLSQLAVASSHLAHQLQRERGRTAAILGRERRLQQRAPQGRRGAPPEDVSHEMVLVHAAATGGDERHGGFAQRLVAPVLGRFVLGGGA